MYLVNIVIKQNDQTAIASSCDCDCIMLSVYLCAAFIIGNCEAIQDMRLIRGVIIHIKVVSQHLHTEWLGGIVVRYQTSDSAVLSLSPNRTVDIVVEQ